MDKESIKQKVFKILSQYIDVNNLNMDSELIGPTGIMDSVLAVNIIAKIESTFNVDFFKDIELNSLQSISSIIDYIYAESLDIKEID